jgi:hypothetical protein
VLVDIVSARVHSYEHGVGTIISYSDNCVVVDFGGKRVTFVGEFDENFSVVEG